VDFIAQLWQPILLSAALVFIASAIMWTVLPFHNREFKPLSTGEDVSAAIKKAGVGSGMFVFPAQGRGAEAMARWAEGPSGFMTVVPRGKLSMGPMMVKSVIYNVVVAFLVAYVAHHALPVGASYPHVFQIVGAVGFMSYCLAYGPESIWFSRPWSSFLLNAFDALVFGLLMGGTFGWLWPK
jgi:hypothetical protein